MKSFIRIACFTADIVKKEAFSKIWTEIQIPNEEVRGDSYKGNL